MPPMPHVMRHHAHKNKNLITARTRNRFKEPEIGICRIRGNTGKSIVRQALQSKKITAKVLPVCGKVAILSV